MKRGALLLLAAVAAFVLGWWSGRRTPDPVQTFTRIDTVYYERPQLASVTSRPVTVNVPRVLFARAPPDPGKSSPGALANPNAAPPGVAGCTAADCGVHCANPAPCPRNCPGNRSEIPTGSPDSVAVAVELQTRVYEDSLYRAQVSGPALGDLRPALDWVEVYGCTVFKTVARPYRWEAGPAAGAWYGPAGSGVWLGAEVRRNVGRLSVGAAGGYDLRNEGPFVELRASLALWRR